MPCFFDGVKADAPAKASKLTATEFNVVSIWQLGALQAPGSRLQLDKEHGVAVGPA